MELQDLPNNAKDDGMTLLCLELLGSGLSRNVYTCTLNPSEWVIKVEMNATGYFQNVAEYLVWKSVRDVKKISHWFAPILNISDSGLWMVQARTRPARGNELPKKVPRFFTDTKIANWGWFEDRIVCHDYGTSLVTENGLTAHMQNAEWWE